MFSDVHGRVSASLAATLDAVEHAGEIAVFSSLAHVGDMETLISEVQARGLRMAGFPKGGITLLPNTPVHDEELFHLCEAYCRAPTLVARAVLRQSLYLREYPLFRGGTFSAAPLYHPADTVIKLMELCLRVVEATPDDVGRMMELSPYLHVGRVRSVFESVKSAVKSIGPSACEGAAQGLSQEQHQQQQEMLDHFRQLVHQELDASQHTTGSSPRHIAPVPFAVTSVEPAKLFDEAAVEEDVGVGEAVADLTGQEQVDEVKSGRVEYLQEEDFELVTHSGFFFEGEGDGRRLVAAYVPGALSPERCKRAAVALEPAATTRNLRALTNGGDPPETGIVGYYDYLNNPTQHKCRETNYMRNHFTGVMEGCAPLLRDLDSVYKNTARVHHELQRVAIPTQYQLFGTVFSTITVNRNFRTAVHTDSGDFRSGLGALTVIDGDFEGCHLAIKKLKKAFRLRVGDVLLFDTSLEHGNTQVHGACSEWKRVSLVCYLRNGLMSAVCELERRKHLNRLIVASLENAVGHNTAVNINSVVDSLPPLYVPARLASKLGAAQLSALTFVSERAQKNSGCVLAMTMGLGKTLVALTLCYSYLHQYPDRDILVLVPKPIIRHWVDEHKKWSRYGLCLSHLVASDDQSAREFEDGLYRYGQQVSGFTTRVGHVFILNPEYLWSFMRRFGQFNPVLLIADEGHKVASKGSKLTTTLARLNCPLRIVLSGTPLQNNAEELYRLVGWVNSDVHAVVPQRVFNDLAADINRYIKGDDSAFPEAVLAQRYIQDWMKGFVFREMENDLPPLYDFLLVCSSSTTQRHLEDAIGLSRNAEGDSVITRANDHRVYHLSTHPLCYWGFISGGYESILKGSPAPRADAEPSQRRQLTEAELDTIRDYYDMVHQHRLDAFAAQSGKLTVLVKIVQEVRARGEKVIIFSQYIGSQDLVHRVLTAFDISVFSVRGRDSQERRRDAMAQFATDENLTTLILSTRIAAYGLDFTAANHVVLFDSWWNPQVDAQAIARAYRRNQTKPVTVYRLACEIEDRSVLAVQTRKTALFNCIMHERTSRTTLPGEMKDCADSETDAVRRTLWRDLKTKTLEGGYPALRNVYRYTDSVTEVDPTATPLRGPKWLKRDREEQEEEGMGE